MSSRGYDVEVFEADNPIKVVKLEKCANAATAKKILEHLIAEYPQPKYRHYVWSHDALAYVTDHPSWGYNPEFPKRT